MFAKLRGLDIFFNLGLIIEVLKQLYIRFKGRLEKVHKISTSISWFCDHNKWISETDLKNYWGSNNLNLNKSEPDVLIPILLAKNDRYNGIAIRERSFYNANCIQVSELCWTPYKTTENSNKSL